MVTGTLDAYFVLKEPNEVVVSYFKDPNYFFVQSKKFLEEKPELDRKINEVGKTSRLVTSVEPHCAYLIKMPQPETWYRGKTIARSFNAAEVSWMVFYMDYGYQERVHVSRLINFILEIVFTLLNNNNNYSFVIF